MSLALMGQSVLQLVGGLTLVGGGVCLVAAAREYHREGMARLRRGPVPPRKVPRS